MQTFTQKCTSVIRLINSHGGNCGSCIIQPKNKQKDCAQQEVGLLKTGIVNLRIYWSLPRVKKKKKKISFYRHHKAFKLGRWNPSKSFWCCGLVLNHLEYLQQVLLTSDAAILLLCSAWMNKQMWRNPWPDCLNRSLGERCYCIKDVFKHQRMHGIKLKTEGKYDSLITCIHID